MNRLQSTTCRVTLIIACAAIAWHGSLALHRHTVRGTEANSAVIDHALALPMATNTGFDRQDAQADAQADAQQDAARVKAVLKNKCYACHGALQQEGGLRLDSVDSMLRGGDSGPAIEPGDPEFSYLFERITAPDPFDRMPPEGEPVSAEQLALISRWIEQGARVPADDRPQPNPDEHWAFQPLKRGDDSSLTQIDQFIDRGLANVGLQRAPLADRVTLIRRLYLDMHGLPPTPEQVEAFLQDDREEAWSELVEQVLASPRYGERWAQHWLDIVRYADTHGFEVNTPRPNAWPYRDYVIESINIDKPYDQFIFEQLAGDTLDADAATGFLVAAPVLLPGQIGKDDESIRLARQDALDEMIVGTGATFLGITIGCARCHDHKFDPFTQRDYYSFQAFFAGVDYGDREIRDEETRRRTTRANELAPQLVSLRAKLLAFEPAVSERRTVVIDDEDDRRVTHLNASSEIREIPPGSERGFRNDVGDSQRIGNIGGGRFTSWDNDADADFMAWDLGVAGRFRIWISWAADGSGSHTRDARIVLDIDGDPVTTQDQQDIATVDQRFFADVNESPTGGVPAWSGLYDIGIHEIHSSSRLILRGGDTGTVITADVMVVQEVGDQMLTTVSDGQSNPDLRSPVNARRNVERFAARDAKFVRFTTHATENDNFREPCLDELEVFGPSDPGQNIALATNGVTQTSSGNYSETGIHQLKHINDGLYGNSHSWISNSAGAGWVQLEFPDVVSIDRIEWGRDREQKFADRLSIEYQIEVSLDGEDWNVVASSSDRMPFGSAFDDLQTILRHSDQLVASDVEELVEELARVQSDYDELILPRLVYAGTFREPDPTFLLRRGDPEQPASEMMPQVPVILGDLALSDPTSDEERRRALASWIADAENPLTARVMVNRVWQYHFGRGLVETSSDFGLNGSTPVHRDLLDWLAMQLIDRGWSIKELHRLILMSETYRQSSRIDAAAEVVDADVRLLWRFPARRLEGEAIRDSILAVSGQLNLEMGGPGFDFFQSRGGLSGFPPVTEFGASQLRRMIYAHKIRMEPVPVFGAFDCPDAGQAMPRRSRSTTAIQALNLFNSPFMIEQSERLALRLAAEAGDSLEAQIDLAFGLTFGRAPNEFEKQVCVETARAHGMETVCRALFNSNEFLFLP